MAITDINISEQLQTDAPSIKYTGNEGPQASPQHQQEQMIARQIWDALGPEQQGQFQSFEQFFQSGVWKQILQQMQADEGQGPEQQQGIGSLGPRPMQQQMPMPRMGAEYGGRMGYQGGEMVEGIKEGIIVIVPSFTHHFVNPNKTRKQRTVISFDLLPELPSHQSINK